VSDDLLDLRLRVARALNVQMYYEEECDGERYYYYAEGERIHKPLPDYPADLGACQEVLDAIRERNWRYRIQDGRGEHGEYAVGVSLMDATRTYAWPQVVAPTLPEALCRAFVEAVEANGE